MVDERLGAKKKRRLEDVVCEASSAELACVHDQNPFGAARLRAGAPRCALLLQERDAWRYGVVDASPPLERGRARARAVDTNAFVP